MLAVQNGTVQEGVGQQAAGLGDQLAYGTDLAAQFVVAGLIDRAVDGDAVLIEGIELAYRHFVTVLHDESTELRSVDRADFVALAVLADHRHIVGKGTSGEAARIRDEVFERLAVLEFKAHRAFHLAADLDHAGVGLDHDHVSLFQADVVLTAAVHQEIVYVDRPCKLAGADDGNGTQGAGFLHAAGHVEGVEHGGEG